MSGKRKQVPGKEFTFISKRMGEDTGILPSVWGQVNEFACWQKSPSLIKGGRWVSRKFWKESKRRQYSGEGDRGLLGRMLYLASAHKNVFKKCGYAPPNVSAEQMLIMWTEQNHLCAACKGPLKLLDAHFDHCHETGEPRGFLHKHCNQTEGCILKMSNEELKNYMNYIGRIRGTEV